MQRLARQPGAVGEGLLDRLAERLVVLEHGQRLGHVADRAAAVDQRGLAAVAGQDRPRVALAGQHEQVAAAAIPGEDIHGQVRAADQVEHLAAVAVAVVVELEEVQRRVGSTLAQGHALACGRPLADDDVIGRGVLEQAAGGVAQLELVPEAVAQDPGVADRRRGHDPQAELGEQRLEAVLGEVGVLLEDLVGPVGAVVLAQHELDGVPVGQPVALPAGADVGGLDLLEREAALGGVAQHAELAGEALEQGGARAGGRVLGVGFAVVGGQVEQDLGVGVGRGQEVPHDQHAVLGQHVGLGGQAAGGGVVVVAVEGRDVVQDRRVEHAVERRGAEHGGRDVAFAEAQVRQRAVALGRALDHLGVHVDAGHGQRRIKGRQRVAARARSHAHVGDVALAEEVGGGQRDLLPHGHVHAAEVAIVSCMIATVLRRVGLVHRPAHSSEKRICARPPWPVPLSRARDDCQIKTYVANSPGLGPYHGPTRSGE